MDLKCCPGPLCTLEYSERGDGVSTAAMVFQLTFFCKDHERYFDLSGKVESAESWDERAKYR